MTKAVWRLVLALLNQRNLAGLGNVYANELSFLRGLRPDTPIRSAWLRSPTRRSR